MLTRTLTSLQHPIVKYLVKLKQERSFRRSEKKVLVCGHKLISELSIQNHPFHTLLQVPEKSPKMVLGGVETYHVTESILKKITGLEHPEPMAAVVALPSFQDVSDSKSLLVLDGIADPGNMGTLIRSALALGWNGVYITDNSCDPFNDKALRSAKGATFRMPLQEGSWDQFLSFAQQKQMHVFLADIEGRSLDQIQPSFPLALILSRESQGARSQAKEIFPSITIPMQGTMESLNVAGAGAILLYSLKRHA